MIWSLYKSLNRIWSQIQDFVQKFITATRLDCSNYQTDTGDDFGVAT